MKCRYSPALMSLEAFAVPMDRPNCTVKEEYRRPLREGCLKDVSWKRLDGPFIQQLAIVRVRTKYEPHAAFGFALTYSTCQPCRFVPSALSIPPLRAEHATGRMIFWDPDGVSDYLRARP